MAPPSVPPDLPPLEVLTNEEDHHSASSSSRHTKSMSESVKKSKPPAAAAGSSDNISKQHPPSENPLFVNAVIVALVVYLAACAYAYLCPPVPIPWEVEFALPIANVSSNCSVNIFHPLEGQVTSRNVIEFELHAPSNTTNVSQIMQYTICIDGVLVVTDLAIIHRRDPTPFSTDALHALAAGDHTVTFTLVVPLPGGREDVVHVERHFHLVPPGSPVVKVSLPRKATAPQSPDKVCIASHGDAASCNDLGPVPTILSPSNGSSFPVDTMIAIEVANFFTELAIVLNGVEVQLLPRLADAATSKQLQRGVLVGLHPGHHTLEVHTPDKVDTAARVWFHVVEES